MTFSNINVVTTPFNRIELEKQRVGCQYVIDNLTLSQQPDLASDILDEMVISLRSYVLSQRLVDDTYTAYSDVPANVWQMFKERHAPEWFVTRFPVRYDRKEIKVRFERYAAYPDASIRDDRRLGKVVFYEKATQLTDWGAV